jgi:hypothetical protein
MDSKPAFTHSRTARRAARVTLGAVFACALLLSAAAAMAQHAGAPPAKEPPGFFTRMGQWFDQGAQNFNAGIKSLRDRFTTFGHDASVAARDTVDNTKAAADAVARLPNTRVVRGHAKCRRAPNGAPDCVAAAVAVCKKKGFKGGSSVDMTTAEVCPAKVYLAGRNSGPGCHTETFVSRAICQ